MQSMIWKSDTEQKIKNLRQPEFLLTDSVTIREMLDTFLLLDLKRGGEKTNWEDKSGSKSFSCTG